jgi:hypothetical protein
MEPINYSLFEYFVNKYPYRLAGVLVGVALCSFAGLKLEGLGGDKPPGSSVRTAAGNPIYQIDTSGEPSTGVITRYDERSGGWVPDEQAIARQRRDEETNQRNMNIAPLTPLSGGG